jgi:glutathione synthase/RimK-type ligase-like ATP-grasp enzyme
VIVAIHRDTAYADRFGDQWAACLEARGIQVRWVDLTRPDAIAQVAGCDGAMWRFGHLPEDRRVAPRVLSAIEQVLGIPVFPDHRTAWHYDEKVSQYYLLTGAGFPMPETWIFWDRERALRWAETATYPKIFKLSAGSSGLNVVRVASADAAAALIERMFGAGIAGGLVEEPAPAAPSPLPARRALVRRARAAVRELLGRPAWAPAPPPPPRWDVERGYAYFQEWIDHDFDTRIITIGERAFGYLRMPFPGDFRASRSFGPRDYDPGKVDPRAVALALDVSRRLGFQAMAFDFMHVRGAPVILEMSYTFGVGAHRCPGYWTPSLQWVERDCWPYLAQIEDFAERLARVGPGGGAVSGERIGGAA